MLTKSFRSIARVSLTRSSALTQKKEARLYQKRASELRVGDIIEHKDRLWTVTRADHTKMAQRRASMQVELAELKTGNKGHDRFSVDDDVECPEVENKKTVYLGPSEEDPEMFLFRESDPADEDNPQIFSFAKKEFPLHYPFYFTPERTTVYLKLIDDQPVVWTRKTKWFVAKVVSVDTNAPVRRSSRGDSAKSSANTIEGLLENGRKVMIPSFIKPGEQIVIDSATEEFERRYTGEEDADDQQEEQ